MRSTNKNGGFGSLARNLSLSYSLNSGPKHKEGFPMAYSLICSLVYNAGNISVLFDLLKRHHSHFILDFRLFDFAAVFAA